MMRPEPWQLISDPELRQQIADACLLDDVTREDVECRIKQRSSDDGLVYKTNENALLPKQAEIDAVSRDDLMAVIDDIVGIIADETAAQFRKLEAEISQLRADLEAMRNQKASPPILRVHRDVA